MVLDSKQWKDLESWSSSSSSSVDDDDNRDKKRSPGTIAVAARNSFSRRLRPNGRQAIFVADSANSRRVLHRERLYGNRNWAGWSGNVTDLQCKPFFLPRACVSVCDWCVESRHSEHRIVSVDRLPCCASVLRAQSTIPPSVRCVITFINRLSIKHEQQQQRRGCLSTE
ncbi:hypothetical protein AND_001139 [Anopheles darlingi]|uniref:Uncharacterized protein n=1 Tax=Anopheles darlingi TaxID=43151 RepID=W5JVK4_ANODA|nr:hypothetical protein AND_001139 [Anopheles darlingi]